MRKNVSKELASHHFQPRLSFLGPVVHFIASDFGKGPPILRALQNIGYEVKWVHLGPGTAESLRKNKRLQHAQAELVILDASETPQTAMAYLEALRGVDGVLPVIVIAGADPATRAESLRLGAEAVIDAPIDVSLLRSVAESLTPLFRGAHVEIEPRRQAFQ